MVKKAKYPAQNLTEEDKKIIDQVVFKFAVYFLFFDPKIS